MQELNQNTIPAVGAAALWDALRIVADVHLVWEGIVTVVCSDLDC